jgi:hypothetical protein
MVPGCEGKRENSHGNPIDYCYDPSREEEEEDLPHLDFIGQDGHPEDVFPLGLCEGDCDNDRGESI